MKPVTVTLSLALVLLLVTPIASNAQKTISGTISTSTVLDTVGGAIYEVTGGINVTSGATLTIDPGVVLKFNISTGLAISDGTLLAVGGASQDSLIYFTSIRDDNAPAPFGDDTNGDGNTTVPNDRDWTHITFNNAASDASILQHCIIRFGGRGNTGNIVLNDASPTVEDCDISAAYYGVRCNGVSNPVLRNTSINAMIDVPIAIEIEADPVFDNLAFESSSDNGFDAIGLLGGTLNGANVLRRRGATLGASPIDNFVYILLSDITIDVAGSLTIEPGVVVKPKSGVDVFVDGTLTMDGTADPDSQIAFTSFKDDNLGTPNDTNNDGSSTSPSQGDWRKIEFRAGSLGSVSNVILKFGGTTSQGMLRVVSASPPITDCVVSDSEFGIEIQGTSSSAVTGCSISNTNRTPFLLSITADPSFSGNSFTNVGIAALGLIGETVGVNADIPVRTVAGFTNITYWLNASLTISTGAAVTIAPGVVMKFREPSTYPNFFVEGGFIADGTPDSVIVFTSLFDDDFGNPADTQGNGSATTPSQGNWGYIQYRATAVDSLSILDHCVLSYGGRASTAYEGVVWCQSASPTITNNEFLTNDTGVRTDGNSAPLIADNNFFNNDEVPIATSVVANPEYTGNTFDQNNYHAVGILSETLGQDAVLERIEVGGPPQFTEFFPYLHLGTLTIGSGATLAVDPGIVVKVLASQVPITVNGGLSIAAPPESVVVYTTILDDSFGGDSNVDGSATSPAVGNWSRILFNNTTIDSASALQNCLFRFGGNGSGVLDLQSASPTIRDCEFELNNGGIWIQNASNPMIEDNLFRLINRAPISKSVLAQPTFSGNTYDNNEYDCLGLIGESIGQDLTVRKWNVAGFSNITRALVGSTLDVSLGSTLTIEPGVVLKMGRVSGGPFQSIISIEGALVAQGTADPDSHIVFTSIRDDSVGNPSDTNNDGSLTVPARFDWREITYLDVSDDAQNLLEYCDLRYGGWNGYAVRIRTASPTISNCDFDTNYFYGIQVEGASSPLISDCTFSNHTITPVVMSLTSDPVFSGNQFLASNAHSALGILGETLAQDAVWRRRNVAQTENIPYLLVGNLTAGLSSILRIEPGVVIKPRSNVQITIKRGLIAEGTADPESLIVFTSPRDDFYGGDTNNDGGATDGSSERWSRINIDNEAIDDSTRFSYCVFRYSVNSTTIGALNITNANPQVKNSIFTQNGIGLNYIGASGDSTKGRVESSDIFGNTHFGIKNTGMSFTVWAQDCWWGDASGPLDNSDDTATGGLYNPGGLGDTVTDRVDYSNWRTTGVQNFLLGDVSLNGEVRAFDASLVLQHLALLIALTPQQQTVGDVNCSGALSTLDASFILRYVAGINSFLPCALDSVPTAPLPGRAEVYPGSETGDFRVRIPEFVLPEGESVVVPIEVSGLGEIVGHEYHLRLGSPGVTVEDVSLTAEAEGSVMAWSSTEAGDIHIALASPEVLPVTGAVELTLRGVGLRSGEPVPLTCVRAVLNEQDVTPSASSAGGVAIGESRPFALLQNRPNPFSASTRIRYVIPESGGGGVHVRLAVYDLGGRRVRTLVDREESPGILETTWDGRDDRGRIVSNGVYFYRIEATGLVTSKKMFLVR